TSFSGATLMSSSSARAMPRIAKHRAHSTVRTADFIGADSSRSSKNRFCIVVQSCSTRQRKNVEFDSGMHCVKHDERQRSEEKNRQPCGQDRRYCAVFAEEFAAKRRQEKDPGQNQAKPGADEHVAILIPKNDRKTHEHEQHA